MEEREMKVKGTELRYVDWSNNWRGETGTLAGGSGTPGECWPEGDRIYYNDNNGATRYLPYEIIAGSDTPWKMKVKGNWVRYVKGTGDIREWHTDIPHIDTGHDQTHLDIYDDTPHYNIPHSDTGHDQTHLDIWDDVPPWDDHYNGYFDTHTDDPPYSDEGWDDHYDGYFDTHTDTIEHDDRPELV